MNLREKLKLFREKAIKIAWTLSIPQTSTIQYTLLKENGDIEIVFKEELANEGKNYHYRRITPEQIDTLNF